MSACLHEYLSAYLPVWISACLHEYLSAHLSTRIPFCPSIYMNIYLFICLHEYLSVRLSTWISIYMSVFLSGSARVCCPACPIFFHLWGVSFRAPTPCRDNDYGIDRYVITYTILRHLLVITPNLLNFITILWQQTRFVEFPFIEYATMNISTA